MEIWDVLDSAGNPTGRTMTRGEPAKPGDYHLVVHVWIENDRGQFLITKRSPEKKAYPGFWTEPAGCVVSGEDSLAAALRETKEETGLALDPTNASFFGRVKRSFDRYPDFADVWKFRAEADVAGLRFHPGEVCDARWATPDEILAMYDAGEFIPTLPYLGKLFGK
jgi:8-oxo-dGTP pyrophosphatase MutT (NUDIX family)